MCPFLCLGLLINICFRCYQRANVHILRTHGFKASMLVVIFGVLDPELAARYHKGNCSLHSLLGCPPHRIPNLRLIMFLGRVTSTLLVVIFGVLGYPMMPRFRLRLLLLILVGSIGVLEATPHHGMKHNLNHHVSLALRLPAEPYRILIILMCLSLTTVLMHDLQLSKGRPADQ